MNRTPAPPRETTYRYRLENLHCAACERRVRAAFAGDARVIRIDVDLAQHTVTLHALDAGLASALLAPLAAAGFMAAPDTADASGEADVGPGAAS